ncbi:MAG: LacI family DNA-binding transcriptional regulator, partial [Microbacterium sp.]
MTATLRDVAAAAGVHVSTASRAMSPETEHLVNPATVRRVLRAAQSLSYVANPLARGLKTNRSLTLGFVVPDIMNPLFPPMIRGFEDVVTEQGYSAITANTDNDPVRQRQVLFAMQGRRIDGLVLASAVLEQDDVIRDLRLPIVLVNRVDPELGLSSVAGDEESGLRQAVEHLVALGHRRIAHIAGPRVTSTGLLRRRAFQHALRDAGLEVREHLVIEAESYSIEEGDRCMDELIARDGEFTAVVAGNDLIALGCCDAMRRRGVDCPADVSVIG